MRTSTKLIIVVIVAWIVIVASLSLVSDAFSAWTYEQLFNALNTGDLDTQDSWARNSGGVFVQATTTCEGAKALSFANGDASDDYTRTISNVSEGIFYIAGMVAGTPQGDAGPYVMLYVDTTRLVMVRFGPVGNIEYFTGGSWETHSSSTPDTWHILAIEVDDVGQNDKYRFNVKTGESWGTWSAWVSMDNPYVVINKIRLDHEGSANVDAWLDTITGSDPTCAEEEEEETATTTSAIFLKNIAYIFFFTTGDYLILLMALSLVAIIFAVLFNYLTKD